MASVFLSYDHDDAARAAPIASALETAGHSVWWDRHIHGGAEYNSEIEGAVAAADAVVVLWSDRSVRSAWVRDEAAEGRDQGKLVPVTLDGTKPPMGFRQYQTIAIPAWKGRKPPTQLAGLLHAIQTIAAGRAEGPVPSPKVPGSKLVSSRFPRLWLVAAGALMLVLGLGAGVWAWIERDLMPVVEVAAGDSSPKSQAAASDLFVKLGSLAQIGKGKWQLVDASAAPSRPDFVLRTGNAGTSDRPRANLVLLDGKDDALLWSREFSFPAGGEADLRHQLALTAGRVLQCALESRAAGGLRRDLLKAFLSACSVERSFNEPRTGLGALRSIVAAKPDFAPAWAALISVDIAVLDYDTLAGDAVHAMRTLRADMAKARTVDPELPELALAERRLLPATAYGKRLQLLEDAASRDPENADILSELSFALQSVGRMSAAIDSARRAAELSPLEPTTQYIMALAYAGQTERARQELAKAERLWAGTGELRDALWAFHLRFGDPEIARKYAPSSEPGIDLYLDARASPSPANVERLMKAIREYESHPGMYGAIQDLGELNRTEDVFRWIARTPTERVAGGSYVLFRPSLAGVREDPRFMQVAKRAGLLGYWTKSGKWPDFCFEPDLPYDCKKEAAKLAA